LKWKPDELEYMRQRYEVDGATSTTLAKEMTELTGHPTTGAAIRNVSNRRGGNGGGSCNADKAENIAARNEEIIQAREEGASTEELAQKYGLTERQIRTVAPGRDYFRDKELLSWIKWKLKNPIDPNVAPDPITTKGKTLFERRHNECCHPIGRDPKTNEIRFCGEHTMTSKRRSSYCERHHKLNHDPS
jgi:Mor family transcriptional regulator